jgi:16S rRNA (uracil1498-N3)-methyltransferase
LFIGDVPLDPVQARHARDVLRLEEGTAVEVFDSEGGVATGSLKFGAEGAVFVTVKAVSQQAEGPMRILVASAIPKGERADWMVEKLSELGVATFIPLAAERSVTLPKGGSKFERWARIATESAKQSRRAGVMTIEPLTGVEELLAGGRKGYLLSTVSDSRAMAGVLADAGGDVLLAIGPEGGWTDRELIKFKEAGYTAVRLTSSILRTETAAVAAAAVVAVMKGGASRTTGTRE